MAYQQDFNSEDDQKQTKPVENVISGDNSTTPAPGTGAASSNSSNQSQKTGSGFTNLSTYVNANNEQAGGMANSLIGDLRNNISNNNNNLDSLSQSVNSDVSNNTVKDSGVIDTLKTSPSRFSDQSLKDQYDKQIRGYQGNTDVSQYAPYQDLSKKFNQTDTQEKSLSDPFAVKTALRQKYDRPNYTGGENTLDSFLTNSGQGAENIKQFQNDYNTNNPLVNFQNTSKDLTNRLQSAKSTSDQTANDTKQAYNSALTNTRALLNQKQSDVSNMNTSNEKSLADLRTKLASGDQSALQQVGFALPQTDSSIGSIDPNSLTGKSTTDELNWLKNNGYDLNSLVNSTGNAKLGDVASENDINSYMALLGLSPGQQSEYDFSKSGISSPSINIANPIVDSYNKAYAASLPTVQAPKPEVVNDTPDYATILRNLMIPAYDRKPYPVMSFGGKYK